MGTVEWVACDATSGKVIADLPDLAVESVEEVMVGYATTSAVLPIPSFAGDWREATKPGAVYIVLLEDGLPTWGALVVTRTTTSASTVTMSLGTFATYFRRRYVGDVTYSNDDQCSIVEALATAYAADSLPLSFDVSASSVLRDRTYEDDSDKSLYSVLTELAAIMNGPEWAVDMVVGEADGQTTYTPRLRVADRLGSSPAAGLTPAVSFDMPGPVQEFVYVEDYSADYGANDVLATSSAIDDTRPESDHAVSSDDRLVFERRFEPSTSITDIDTLNEHAEAELARVAEGTRSLTVVLNAVESPRPGIDFALGDVVGFQLASEAYPLGLTGTARLTGFKRTFGDAPTLEPYLTDLTVSAA